MPGAFPSPLSTGCRSPFQVQPFWKLLMLLLLPPVQWVGSRLSGHGAIKHSLKQLSWLIAWFIGWNSMVFAYAGREFSCFLGYFHRFQTFHLRLVFTCSLSQLFCQCSWIKTNHFSAVCGEQVFLCFRTSRCQAAFCKHMGSRRISTDYALFF